MAETAAHLVDHVLPRVPMRQWVLSFPWPLRLRFAAHPQWLTRGLGVVTRALSGAVLKRARLRRAREAHTGIVTFIQRFGSKLNLNVHLHLLVPDRAYTFEHGKPHFHRAPAPHPDELNALLDTLIRRITRTSGSAPVCSSSTPSSPSSTYPSIPRSNSSPLPPCATSSPSAPRLNAPPCVSTTPAPWTIHLPPPSHSPLRETGSPSTARWPVRHTTAPSSNACAATGLGPPWLSSASASMPMVWWSGGLRTQTCLSRRHHPRPVRAHRFHRPPCSPGPSTSRTSHPLSRPVRLQCSPPTSHRAPSHREPTPPSS